MSRTNCADLWATDEVFRLNTPGACDVPLIAYSILVISASVCKIIVCFRQSKRWFRRRRHADEHDQPLSGRSKDVKSSFPYQPLHAFVFAMSYVLFFVTTVTGVANFKNALALCIYTFAYIPYAWLVSFALFRLVALGERIIPKAHRGTEESKKLASFDKIGKSMAVIQVFSMVVSCIVLIVLAPILPQHETMLLQVGFGFKATFLLAIGAGFCYQYERCIRTIQTVQTGMKDISRTAAADASTNLEHAVRKMRKNQLLHIAFNAPAALILISLTTGAFPAIVWVVIAPPCCEAVATLMHELFLGAGSRRGPKQVKNDVKSANEIVVAESRS